uniref:DJ-1/PfpI family protein n=1 Tax=uncultured Dysgonomonas sp. TaxID=206096 RepID=UPI00262ACBCE|nr:DJ-1/PfpI family protein [uncultured Dysgonomonas sp.]
MQKKNVYIYLFDGFSDWEIAYLTPELKKNKEINLLTFSDTGKSVFSMGGLEVIPNISSADIDISGIDLLLLPGGFIWETNNPDQINVDCLVEKVYLNKKSIAAICGATIYLARKGYLNNIEHTSNDLNYLKMVAPEYKGEQYYQNQLAVSHNQIITANGIAPIEFAQKILEELKFDGDYVDKWFQLFKNGIWSE